MPGSEQQPGLRRRTAMIVQDPMTIRKEKPKPVDEHEVLIGAERTLRNLNAAVSSLHHRLDGIESWIGKHETYLQIHEVKLQRLEGVAKRNHDYRVGKEELVEWERPKEEKKASLSGTIVAGLGVAGAIAVMAYLVAMSYYL